jgi:hypothetical protein
MSAVEKLRDWFDKLGQTEQQEIVRFLYGGPVLLKEGMYLGPHPEMVQKGLHCGPIPMSSVRICQSCGRPL